VIKSFWFWFWFWVTKKFKYLFGVFVLGEKMSNPTRKGSNSDTRGATNSAPLTPIEFLKSFTGKTVRLKAKGVFAEDLIDRSGRVLKTEVFNGYMEGKYRVTVGALGNILLRYPYHIIEFKKIEWLEVNGQEVRGE